jgi:hypothetical protein
MKAREAAETAVVLGQSPASAVSAMLVLLEKGTKVNAVIFG